MTSSKETKETFTVGFLILTNLKIGAGVERVIQEFVENAPVNVKTKLIQTDFVQNSRLEDEQVERFTDKCETFTLKVHPERGRFINRRYIGFLYNFVIFRLLIYLYLKKNKDIFYNFIKDLDVIYLVANNFAYLFKKTQIVIVGSQLVDFEGNNRGFFWRAKLRLISKGLIYRNLDGFTLYPYNDDLTALIKPDRNFVTMPRGVDTNIFYPLKKIGKLRFLFVARLEKYKGINFIIKVWKQSKIDAELHIVGAGSQSQFVQKEAKNDPSIIYHGIVNYEDLAELYGASDVFLVPSNYDTYSTVVLEAFSAGCFIIMSRYLQKVHSWLISSRDGMFLDLKDEVWKNALKNIVGSKDQIRSSASKRHEIAVSKFDTKAVTTSFYERLQVLVSKCKQPKYRSSKDRGKILID